MHIETYPDIALCSCSTQFLLAKQAGKAQWRGTGYQAMAKQQSTETRGNQD